MGEPRGADDYFRTILDELPAAIYTTDAAGRIIYYNEAAAELWGVRPELGKSEWCGSWKLFWPNGDPLPHGDCPMALAIKQKRPIRGVEAVAERPDGVRVPFIPYPTPLFASSGALIGAVNMLVDITDRKRAEELTQRMAAIVASSDDAIISKDLDGVIRSWNEGAERLFGYTAAEAIGQPMTMLIPEERQNEEPTILARIRAGERIDHYETVRQRKDGSFIEISITVSPVRNQAGEIVGASKIARDITERLRAQERQNLLLQEMDHRIKNLFTLASGVVSLSARSATSAEQLARDVRERLGALARAHALTLTKPAGPEVRSEQPTTLHALIRTIVSPYGSDADQVGGRLIIAGPDITLSGGVVTSFALLLHEFATNAAKYGALSVPEGHLSILCSNDDQAFHMSWEERGGPRIDRRDDGEGFGSLLARSAVQGQLGGSIAQDWKPEGLAIHLSVARERLGT
ncbi:PAS domain S-box protein [Phenylobacterium sp. LjRoot219]|uniref:PAS domain S-box protein n=1 Tax=Phenylobacterium sp. LjRoot219 TaxID=3342283 RepID=UPI003ED13591